MINFVGCHSTGKTTLFEKIAEKNNRFDFINENAREIFGEKNWNFRNIDSISEKENFKYFQKENLRRVLKNKLSFPKSIIQFYDRSLLDPVAYLEYNSFQTKNWKIIDNLFKMASRDVNIIFKPHKKLLHWDGVRKEDSIEELMSFHDFFKKLLDDGNVPYYEIEEVDLFERMKIVKQIVYSETGVEINI